MGGGALIARMPRETPDGGGEALPSDPGDVAPASEDRGQLGNGSPLVEGKTPPTEQLVAELTQAQAERDAAVTALDKRGRRQRRHVKARRLFVGLLVVVFALLLPITFVLTWAHNIVINDNGWNRTVGPLASDPAVTAVVANGITNQVFASLNPQQSVANALPPKASFLAGPVTNGARGYVNDGVNKVLQSQRFQTLWRQATQFAHTQLVDVLEGKSKAVTTTNGQVVLNLVPLFNAALQNIQGFVSGVVGKPVTLPTISGNEVPSSACRKIGAALNRPVPDSCGQIPLFPADKLTQAQRAVRVFNRLVVLLLIVTPVVAALALWLSRRRRRTLLQLTVGGILGLVVARRATIWLQDTLINTGKPENKAAREAIVTQLLHAFFSISRWLLIGLVIVLAVSLITGPYAWARSVRGWARQGELVVADLATATAGRAGGDRTVAWMRSHLDLLRIAGVGVAVLLLLVLSVSFIGFLVIAALLLAYELWLQRFAANAAPPAAPVAGPPAAPAPPIAPSARPPVSAPPTARR
jgi:hypothetical protein